MPATRDARTAKRKLSELGITSATVLTGSTTITIDLAAFDEMVAKVLNLFGGLRDAMLTAQPVTPSPAVQQAYDDGVLWGQQHSRDSFPPGSDCACGRYQDEPHKQDCLLFRGRDGLTRIQRGPTS